LRITLHKARPLPYPALRTLSSGPADLGGEGAYVTTGVGPDLYAAAQDAVRYHELKRICCAACASSLRSARWSTGPTG
jgi:hypothetical protein